MAVIRETKRSRLYFTLAVALFEVLHLGIELLNGGVLVHFPLMRSDMPGLSNWWGLLVLPTLAWVLYGFMAKGDEPVTVFELPKPVLYRFIGAFVYCGMLGASFELDLGETPMYFLLGLIVAGIAYPIYRAEMVLGFIMGMTYTFGAIIPTVVITIVAFSSLLLHNLALLLLLSLIHI